LQSLGNAYKDDGVECEKLGIIQIKMMLKFMSVMSLKFALGFVRIIRPSVSHAL